MDRLLAQLTSAIEPFRHLDYGAWFNFSKPFNLPAAVACLVIGLACALVGARHYLFRVFAAPMGIVLGVLITPEITQLLHSVTKVPPKLVALALPGLLGLLCAIVPLALVFVAAGLLGAQAGQAFFSEQEWLIGASLGFFLVGGVAVALGRYVSVVLTAVVGGLLATGALLALMGDSPIGRLVNYGPTGPVGLAALVAVAGAALQFVTHKDEDQHLEEKAKKREKAALEKENREREKRYASYRKG